MPHHETPSVDEVRRFWESNPLWTGESRHPSESREFYEEHRQVVIDDCLGGRLDQRIFPDSKHRDRVLDLGCGPGFWTVELGNLGCRELHAADLTENALHLARKRCELFVVKAVFSQQNAERMTYPSTHFSHVNCQGVIHHTPDTEKCVAEIARVLRPDGTVSLSVYYRHAVLRLWPLFHRVGKALADSGAALKGRGRENIFRLESADEIVRTYDGSDNPIGKAYSKSEFHRMLAPYFDVTDTFFHFFPARALPFKIPKPVHRLLDDRLGFMIYIRGVKR